MSRACAAVLLVCLCLPAAAQDSRPPAGQPGLPVRVDSFTVALRDTVTLSQPFAQRRGMTVLLDGFRLLRDSVEFVFDEARGTIRMAGGLPESRDTLRGHALVVRYAALPVALPRLYRLRELVVRRDSARGDSIAVAVPSTPITLESIFGSGLQKSGYIGRGFTVATNRDLTLNSGFRLQLSGKLSPDISLLAALTDENTPIQPEGNTRTLQELDKVYITLGGPHFSATVGDFTLSRTATEFGRYNRKLSGFLGETTIGPGSAYASYASLKGSYHSLTFSGIDGVQGPYRLTGRNGEQRIVVLAGTERVYVDGVEMVRGENNDYVIEYASGELYFRPRRLIASYSRIVVDFEYADRQYVRSLFSAGGAAALFSDRVTVNLQYAREGDDPDAPIDMTLSDGDRRVLAAAGDDASKASTNGAVYAGYDTARRTGAGQYARVDTTVGGASVVVYRYVPGDDSATWTVTFSYVGSGSGDYLRRTLGFYEYAGPGLGDYAPLRLLPLPQLHQIATLQVAASPASTLQLRAEGAVSTLARNRLSDLDAGDDNGNAYALSGSWKLPDSPVGGLEVSGRLRGLQSTFAAIDRINDIEFARKWNLSSLANAEETQREASLALMPAAGARASVGLGSITRGSYSSQRLEGGVSTAGIAAASWIPRVDYALESITGSDGAAVTRGSWFRHRGELRMPMDVVQPRLRFEAERRRSSAGAQDTLTADSYGFVDLRPGVELPAFWNMAVSAELGWRSEEAWIDGALRPRVRDLSPQLTWSLRNWNALSASATATLRDRHFEDAFRARGEKDVQTLLMKAQAQYAPLQRAVVADALYEVSTERTSRLERVFMKVPYGQGNYVYTGDGNNNGIADESEYEPTRFEGDYVLITMPTDELFPVVDLRSSARLQLRPSRVLAGGGGLLGAVAEALSTETYARIDEKSSDPATSHVYLLRLSSFLNDSTTLRGVQTLRQDVYVFEQRADFSLRFRFEETRGATQFALGNERSFRSERSLRLRAQPVREIGLQADAQFTTDMLSSSLASNRVRSITGSSVTGDLSYRPTAGVEAGLVLSVSSATDRSASVPVDADIASQTLRSILTLAGPGRLRAELERSTVRLSGDGETVPYELTDGKSEGTSWVLRLSLDYRITSYLQATATYLGRTDASDRFLHTARAEVRAFF